LRTKHAKAVDKQKGSYAKIGDVSQLSAQLTQNICIIHMSSNFEHFGAAVFFRPTGDKYFTSTSPYQFSYCDLLLGFMLQFFFAGKAVKRNENLQQYSALI